MNYFLKLIRQIIIEQGNKTEGPCGYVDEEKGVRTQYKV